MPNMDALQALVLIFTVKFSVNYCGSKRTIFFKLIFAKMRIFHDRQKFLTQKFFLVKNICPYNVLPNFRPKSAIPAIVAWSIFQKHPYFQKMTQIQGVKSRIDRNFWQKKLKKFLHRKKLSSKNIHLIYFFSLFGECQASSAP